MVVKGNDMCMTRGDSEAIKVSFRDSNGGNISLSSGDKLYMTVKENIRTQEKIFQKVITSFEDDGGALIQIAPSDTSGVDYGLYVYDIQLVKSDGKVTTVVKPSVFEICGEVTYETD